MREQDHSGMDFRAEWAIQQRVGQNTLLGTLGPDAGLPWAAILENRVLSVRTVLGPSIRGTPSASSPEPMGLHESFKQSGTNAA